MQAEETVNPSTHVRDPLVNVKDVVFPWARSQDLVHIPHMDFGKYGMEKFWNWILIAHGMQATYETPKKPDEGCVGYYPVLFDLST